MRVAILARGPSINQTWRDAYREGYALTIAVNTAIDMQGGSEWLVAYDAKALMACETCPSTGVVTGKRHADGLKSGRIIPGWGHPHVDALVNTELLKACDIPGEKWSLIGALALACHLGAVEVDCYGVDFEGKRYEDGTPMSAVGTRWVKEREAFTSACRVLTMKGVTVTRAEMKGEEPTQDAEAIVATENELSIDERRAYRRLFNRERSESRQRHGVPSLTQDQLDRVAEATQE